MKPIPIKIVEAERRAAVAKNTDRLKALRLAQDTEIDRRDNKLSQEQLVRIKRASRHLSECRREMFIDCVKNRLPAQPTNQDVDTAINYVLNSFGMLIRLINSPEGETQMS